jgi:hypothetical protein
MGDQSKSQSWWQTLPGILTATAAIMTGLTGLIAALYQSGLVGRSDQSTAPPYSTAPKSTGKSAEAAPPAADSDPTPASPAARDIEMPDGRMVTMLDGTGLKFQYTVVSAQREQLSPEKHLLHLRVRVWTNAPGGVNLWSDSFRLKVGDARLKPINFLDELAARDETKEGDVDFEVDGSARETVLVITVGGLNFSGNTEELRLKLL